MAFSGGDTRVTGPRGQPPRWRRPGNAESDVGRKTFDGTSDTGSSRRGRRAFRRRLPRRKRVPSGLWARGSPRTTPTTSFFTVVNGFPRTSRPSAGSGRRRHARDRFQRPFTGTFSFDTVIAELPRRRILQVGRVWTASRITWQGGSVFSGGRAPLTPAGKTFLSHAGEDPRRRAEALCGASSAAGSPC